MATTMALSKERVCSGCLRDELKPSWREGREVGSRVPGRQALDERVRTRWVALDGRSWSVQDAVTKCHGLINSRRLFLAVVEFEVHGPGADAVSGEDFMGWPGRGKGTVLLCGVSYKSTNLVMKAPPS